MCHPKVEFDFLFFRFVERRATFAHCLVEKKKKKRRKKYIYIFFVTDRCTATKSFLRCVSRWYEFYETFNYSRNLLLLLLLLLLFFFVIEQTMSERLHGATMTLWWRMIDVPSINIRSIVDRIIYAEEYAKKKKEKETNCFLRSVRNSWYRIV